MNGSLIGGGAYDYYEEHFMMQLENLKDYVVEEPTDIRKWVKEIVPTYHPQ